MTPRLIGWRTNDGATTSNRKDMEGLVLGDDLKVYAAIPNAMTAL